MKLTLGTARVRKSKATIQQREVRRYRGRLHRIVSLYLALKAWGTGVNCLVLSRSELLKFFKMDSTPGSRMAEIEKDMVTELTLLTAGLTYPATETKA